MTDNYISIHNKDKLFKIIASNAQPSTEIEKINIDMDIFLDLGYDSISFIKLIIDIESEFNIEVEDNMLVMDKWRLISNIIDCLRNRCMDGDE